MSAPLIVSPTLGTREPGVGEARHMGNGKGRPFLWVRASGGRVVFLTHRQAHSLLRWGA